MKSRRTRQLEAVHSALREVGDHPTAAQLHARVRARLPRVSLGTVYRNLEKLLASGDALQVRLGDEPTRYDSMVSPHDHFVCDKCGGITDLDGETPARVDTKPLRSAGYAVRTHSLALFGLCRPCAAAAATARKRPTTRLGAEPQRRRRRVPAGTRRRRQRRGSLL